MTFVNMKENYEDMKKKRNQEIIMLHKEGLSYTEISRALATSYPPITSQRVGQIIKDYKERQNEISE